MRMEGPVVALLLVGFVVVVAVLIASTGRRDNFEALAIGSTTTHEIIKDNVYRLTTCDPALVDQTLQALSRSHRILSMTALTVPCDQLWIVVEPR